MPLNLKLDDNSIYLQSNLSYCRSIQNKLSILECTDELYNRLEKDKYTFFNNVINSGDVDSYSKFIDLINYMFSEFGVYLKNSINKNISIVANMINNHEKVNEFINNIDNRHNCIEYYKNNILDKSSFPDVLLFNGKDIQYIFNDIVHNIDIQYSDFEAIRNTANKYFIFSKNIRTEEEFLEYIYQYPTIYKLFKEVYTEINTQFIEIKERILSTIINYENNNIEEFIVDHKRKISEIVIIIVSILLVVDNIFDNFLNYFNNVSTTVDNILGKNTIGGNIGILASKEDLLEDDNKLEESFSKFYISSYNNDAVYSKLSYYSELAILLEEENNNGTNNMGSKIKERISKTIAAITEMVNKFLANINQLMGVDKKWLADNKDRIMKNDFPNAEGDFDDWYDYKIDELRNSTNIPKFDTNNQELMNALNSDKEFEEFIISKRIVPDIPNSANDKSFKEKCKAAYMGDLIDKKSIKQVESIKSDMLEYCIDYAEGKNGKVYQSIQNQIKNIDDSKKVIDNAINNDTQTQASSTASSNDNNTNQSNNSSSTNESLYPNIPDILGMKSSVIYELKTPKIDKEDKPSSSNMQEKGNRYISMCGVILGAKMTVSLKAYNDYKRVLRWAYGN